MSKADLTRRGFLLGSTAVVAASALPAAEARRRTREDYFTDPDVWFLTTEDRDRFVRDNGFYLDRETGEIWI